MLVLWMHEQVQWQHARTCMMCKKLCNVYKRLRLVSGIKGVAKGGDYLQQGSCQRGFEGRSED